MPDEIRVGGGSERPSSMNPMMRGGNRNNMPWIILAVIILLVIVGAVLFRDKLFPSQDGEKNGSAMKEETLSGYQAVFLTNGQVYFGKLSDMSASYATLNDIYYLQVTQPPLQGSQPEGQQQAQPQLSLVKLGQELHGPVDEMKINRDQILFFEDIKEDGRVMQAIREYQKNPPAEQSGAAPQQTPATTPTNTPQQQTPAN